MQVILVLLLSVTYGQCDEHTQDQAPVPAYVRDMVARLGDRMNSEHTEPEMGSSRVQSNNGEVILIYIYKPYREAQRQVKGKGESSNFYSESQGIQVIFKFFVKLSILSLSLCFYANLCKMYLHST